MIHQRLRVKRLFRLTRVTRLGIVILISSLAFSFVSTIWAVYINSLVNSEALVGFVTAFLIAVSFLSYFFIIPIIERSNKTKLYIFASFFLVIGYFLYSIIKSFYPFIFVALVMVVVETLRITSIGIIVRHISKKRELAKNEGLIYTFSNISYVIGPLIAGFILATIGVSPVFIFTSLILLLSLLVFKLNKIRYSEVRKRIDIYPIKNFLDFFKNKDRLKIYILSGGVNFWWSLIYIYMPLLILKSLGKIWIGYFLFAVAIPLILFEYPFGKLAGRIGFKKLFFIGFLIPAIAALLCFFFSNIWFILISLVVASIGLAMTESTTEAYFFDVLKGKEDQRFYAPYNTAIDTGNIFGRVLPALFLLFLPFKLIFLIFAVGMFLFSLLSLRTRKIIEERRK